MCSYLALPRILTAWMSLLSQSLELENYFRLRINFRVPCVYVFYDEAN